MFRVFGPIVPFFRASGLIENSTYIYNSHRNTFSHIFTRNQWHLYLQLAGQTGTTERESYVEKADFTYKNPKKKRNCQGLSNKRNLDEVYGIVRDLEKKVKQIEQSDNDEENRSSFEQGNWRESTRKKNVLLWT